MKPISILLATLITISCSPTNHSIFWVGGKMTDCTGGAGKMKCLKIYKGDDLNNAKWENFYSSIDGFTFEEGFLKKIEVKEEKIDVKNVPADASSIKYSLVKELEKQADNQLLTEGSWILATINEQPINRMVVLPTLDIDLSTMRISGNNGCNNYSASIDQLSNELIHFGNIASTKMACTSKNMEAEFNQSMNVVKNYNIQKDQLLLLDDHGKQVLAFIKKETNSKEYMRLHDIWAAIRINRNPINRSNSIPNMEINLTEMRVMGNDGCNEYSGAINQVSPTELSFGNIASTRKMCENMEAVDNFNKAINMVTHYKLDGLTLILLNDKSDEVLAFKKVD